MMDTNFKISVTALQVVRLLVDRLGTDLKPHLSLLFPSLIEKLGDSKRIVQQDTLELFSKLTSSTDPQLIIHGLVKRGGEDSLCIYYYHFLLYHHTHFHPALLLIFP